MKKGCKFFSLLMALTLLLGMSVPAYAAEDDALTRGELVQLLIENAGLADQAAASAEQISAFADVEEDSEYEGAINLAYEKGFVSGKGNGCFAPDATVSQVEAAAMILRYAGIPNEVLQAWPKSYNTAVASTYLTEGFDYEASAVATADEVQTMLDNAAAMADKPFIGISWRSNEQDYTKFHKIIQLAGGVALEMPQIVDRASADAAVAVVDGLIVTGGEDINPDLYGEEHSPLLEDNNELRDLRDTSDYNLTQASLSADLPMLSICRGVQMLNVACGGGLIQDLPTYLERDSETYITHRYSASGDYARHDITIDDTSKWLKEIVGANEMANVASWHHQVLNPERLGEGLTVIAYGPEDVIEAVEYQANTFALGIQFHPERDALGIDAKADVDLCLHFFEVLVDYAGK